MDDGIPVHLKRTGCLVGYVHGRLPTRRAGENSYLIQRLHNRRPPITVAGVAIPRPAWRTPTQYTVEVELDGERVAKLWVYVASALYGVPEYDFRLL